MYSRRWYGSNAMSRTAGAEIEMGLQDHASTRPSPYKQTQAQGPVRVVAESRRTSPQRYAWGRASPPAGSLGPCAGSAASPPSVPVVPTDAAKPSSNGLQRRALPRAGPPGPFTNRPSTPLLNGQLAAEVDRRSSPGTPGATAVPHVERADARGQTCSRPSGRRRSLYARSSASVVSCFGSSATELPRRPFHRRCDVSGWPVRMAIRVSAPFNPAGVQVHNVQPAAVPVVHHQPAQAGRSPATSGLSAEAGHHVREDRPANLR